MRRGCVQGLRKNQQLFVRNLAGLLDGCPQQGGNAFHFLACLGYPVFVGPFCSVFVALKIGANVGANVSRAKGGICGVLGACNRDKNALKFQSDQGLPF